jgi:hypothetical protein
VERRPEGDYAIRRGGSDRASDVKPTQREAIERARELNPGHNPLVKRVRHTDVGKPDPALEDVSVARVPVGLGPTCLSSSWRWH